MGWHEVQARIMTRLCNEVMPVNIMHVHTDNERLGLAIWGFRLSVSKGM